MECYRNIVRLQTLDSINNREVETVEFVVKIVA